MNTFQGKCENRNFYLYYGIFLIFIVGGVLDSLYLSISHYRVFTDIGYQSFCALSKSLNCDTVSQSPYAIMLGVPVPVWGVLGYLLLLFLSFLARPQGDAKAPLWTALLAIGLAFSLYSLVLAAISSFIIHSYCLMCILSYAINFGIAFLAWLILKKFGAKPFGKAIREDLSYLRSIRIKAFGTLILFGMFAIGLTLVFPQYWILSKELPQDSAHPSGMTEEGNPWIGSMDPLIEITEFTDYRCFQCKKMHYYLRRLLDKYPKKLRIVHRHFPMDHTVNPIVKSPYHNGAGLLAMMAIVAGQQGKFWKINDAIYQEVRPNQNIGLTAIARKAEMDIEDLLKGARDKTLFTKLQTDIRFGIQLGIVGTPAYLIQGKIYQGGIPEDVLSSLWE